MKYVYLVSMSANYEDHRHCQCHVLGVFRTLKSAMRHFDSIHEDRLARGLFIREFWCIKEKEIMPRGMVKVDMAKFMYEAYAANDTTIRMQEQVTLTRWTLSPQRKKI